MNRALRFTLLGLAVVVVATGCGSSASKPPAVTEWASNVCARLAPYEKAMEARSVRVSHLRPPLNVAGSAIYAEFLGAKRLTMQLVADLKALDLPDTESQTAAKKFRDAAIEQLERDFPKNERALMKQLEKLPPNPTATEVFRILDGLEFFLVVQAVDAGYVVSLAPFVGSKQLQQAFADSEECDKLAAQGK